MTRAPTKMTLDALRAGMRPFLDFPQVEQAIQAEVDQTVEKILLTRAQNGGRHSIEVLTDYLDAGSRENTEDRMKTIIGFSRGSLEKLKRIYEAIFPGASWSLIWRDENIRRRFAPCAPPTDSAARKGLSES